ncbi:hypothetical protein HanHA300_Chr02g0069201 [Helianthus annuus]|nr:hypothetical protein HanHA300_Chr02g0069201 [Helianthus annuus]
MATKGKVGGAMVVATIAEGRPLWLDQIRDRFLHPTSESLAAYANTILGEDGGDDLDDVFSPTREEVIILSSEGSDRSHEGLIPHSPHAGLPQGTMNEPVNEPAGDDVDAPVVIAEQLETRKKKIDKSEGKKAEEPTAKAPRKRPSTSFFLDYVVVSDTLSGLDAGDKRVERDHDDDATLTEIMKKKKVLGDKKKELDEQPAAALAAKNLSFRRRLPLPLQSWILFWGVFRGKHGNLLEKIYAASGSQVTKFFIYVKLGKSVSKVDISKITPPTSPPSRTFDLSPPHVDLGEKRKGDDVEIEQVGEGGGGGRGGRGRGRGAGDGRGGADTEAESSEATPRHTTYTKRGRSFGQVGPSGVCQSPEYEHVQGGSWDTHNPANADLPHAPRWNLTQGTRMTDLNNCREFFSLSLPLAERFFQKRRHRIDLLDDHIHAGVNFFATSQEIAREWQLMGKDTLEFEAAKKALAEEREKFNAEKKGLSWRVADAAEKLAKEKQFNKFAAEKVPESKASEILAEEVTADCKWLLARAVPLISERIAKPDELAKYMFELGQATYNSGRKDGYGEGRAVAASNEKDYHFELYMQDCTAAYTAKRQEYEFIEFGIVKAVKKLSRKANATDVLKKALGDQGTDGGDAGPSRQD